MSDGRHTQNVNTSGYCRGADPEARVDIKLAGEPRIIRRFPSKDQAEREALAQRQEASQQQLVHEGLVVHAIKTDAKFHMMIFCSICSTLSVLSSLV